VRVWAGVVVWKDEDGVMVDGCWIGDEASPTFERLRAFRKCRRRGHPIGPDSHDEPDIQKASP
jgi:hypothetical protein